MQIKNKITGLPYPMKKAVWDNMPKEHKDKFIVIDENDAEEIPEQVVENTIKPKTNEETNIQ